MKTTLVLPCLRGVIGDWVYYSSMMSFKQISDWVMAVKDIRESPTLDDYLQRDLKDRKKAIAKYLLTTENRFFNSIIIGVFDGIPDWIQFDITKKIDEVKGASQEINEYMGLLVFEKDARMFAIDGQHRVAGIQIAYEEDSKKANDKRVLKDDVVSVIFLAHIDDARGKKRTRKLFSDINKNAKPVVEGDKIKIDEEDLNAIVTRRIYSEYKYFKKGKIIALTEKGMLEPGDESHFTNLLGLNNVNKKLRPLFKKERGTEIWDEKNVQEFQKIVEEFYDFVIHNIKEYHDYFIKKSLSLRKARHNNEYILFRPVGLVLLARLYAHFKKNENLNIFKKNILKLSFIMPKSPFNKVLWDNGRMEAKERSAAIAFDLARYILGDYPKENLPKLLEKYREITKNEKASLPERIV